MRLMRIPETMGPLLFSLVFPMYRTGMGSVMVGLEVSGMGEVLG